MNLQFIKTISDYKFEKLLFYKNIFNQEIVKIQPLD